MILIITSVKVRNEQDHLSICAKVHLTGQRLTPVRPIIDLFFWSMQLCVSESEALHCGTCVMARFFIALITKRSNQIGMQYSV